MNPAERKGRQRRGRNSLPSESGWRLSLGSAVSPASHRLRAYSRPSRPTTSRESEQNRNVGKLSSRLNLVSPARITPKPSLETPSAYSHSPTPSLSSTRMSSWASCDENRSSPSRCQFHPNSLVLPVQSSTVYHRSQINVSFPTRPLPLVLLGNLSTLAPIPEIGHSAIPRQSSTHCPTGPHSLPIKFQRVPTSLPRQSP